MESLHLVFFFYLEVVFASVSDCAMDLLDFGFCFLPIAAEFDFAAHATLILRQALLVFFETVERLDMTPIAHRSESNNTDINADRVCHLLLSLRNALLIVPKLDQ